jgi:23S rRNA pseudouridine2605 synthase
MAKERIQKLIAQAGLASRRQAEKWIEEGRVKVNGKLAVLGERAESGKDYIEINGKPLQLREDIVTLLLNKPRGYISTLKDPEGRRLVTDLVKDLPQRVYPIGRLDFNSEGLLLLTNDGALAQRLSHPRHHVAKTYLVKARGQLTPVMKTKLEAGIEIDGRVTAVAQVSNIRQAGQYAWFELTIHEGRNRQVRKMCESIGLSVARLKRIRLGFLDLGDLATGRYRLLTQAEIERLKAGGN